MDRPHHAGASAAALRVVLRHRALRGGPPLAPSLRRADPAGGPRAAGRHLHLHVCRTTVDRSPLAVPGLAGGRLPGSGLDGSRPPEDRCHRRSLHPGHHHGPATGGDPGGRGAPDAAVRHRLAGAVHTAARGILVPVPRGGSFPPPKAAPASPSSPASPTPPCPLGALPPSV